MRYLEVVDSPRRCVWTTMIVVPQNAARAQVGVGPLVWDETVAATARNYANQRAGDCSLVHSGNRNYGENLAMSTGSLSPAEAVKLWTDERQHYDYSSNSCVGVCGHYTQVVWASSVRLGCASVTCSSGGTFVICNYYPPGNFIGQRSLKVAHHIKGEFSTLVVLSRPAPIKGFPSPISSLQPMDAEGADWVQVARRGNQRVGIDHGKLAQSGGGGSDRWFFTAGRKQMMAEKLRSGAIRVVEYFTKQSFSVTIDCRAIPWLLNEISEEASQTEGGGLTKYWHEGMTTISLQRFHNDRGSALKVLKLNGSGRKMIIMPENKGTNRWGGLVEAVEGLVNLEKGKKKETPTQGGVMGPITAASTSTVTASMTLQPREQGHSNPIRDEQGGSTIIPISIPRTDPGILNHTTNLLQYKGTRQPLRE
ncbi:hypothetical protein Sjap_022591 [Stephania japonica]|uniref:SCP domain-containing protein n=1 Tax=Stephania japonica TaxID=461633 RepID=A0AAP0HT12_9MAGN